jgi:hypothetical protein
MITHTAPEGQLTGLIYFVTFGTEIVIFCALFATWLAPAFGDAVLGPRRTGAARSRSLGAAVPTGRP